MPKKEYKPTMLTVESYNVLNTAKKDLSLHSTGRVTFTDVINEYVKKKLIFQHLESPIKDYIYSFINEASKSLRLKGVVLFGSVARGNHDKFSDIDLFMIVEGDERTFYNKEVRKALEETEKNRQRLVEQGQYLHISPLIMPSARIKNFTPIFLDVLDFGLVLYDRDNTANDFLNRLRKIKHRRLSTAAGEILEWK